MKRFLSCGLRSKLVQAKACPDVCVLARPLVKLCAAHGDVCGLDAGQVGSYRIQRVPGKLVGDN